MKFKQRRVPFAYDELTHIESTGTQYIDTGWQPTSKVLAVEFKVNCRSSMATVSICGSENKNFSSARWLFTLYGQDETWRQYPLIGTWNNGQGSGYHISTPQNTDVVARIDYNNGTTTCVSSQGDNWTHTQSGDNILNHKQNLNLFQNASTQKSSIRMYFYKIWDNNTLVRNFIPVIRKIDNVVGMYDTVEGKFYTNAGTGSFIAGEKILTVDKVKIDNYEFYDYLESTGTQYIDTGLKGNLNTAVEIKFEGIKSSTNDILNIFGDITTSTRALSCNTGYTAEEARPTSRFGNTSTGGVPQKLSKNTPYIITSNKNTYTIKNQDGTVYRSYTFGATTAFTTTNNLWMFVCNNSNAPSTYTGSSKFYYCKIWDNDVLVRNFYPAKRKSDGAIGMYDIVNDKLYTNAGTGEFKLGNKISSYDKEFAEQYQALDYIESSGTQWIDAGIKTGTNIKLDYEYEAIAYNGTTYCAPISARVSSQSNSISYGFNNSATYTGFGNSSEVRVSPHISLNKRYHIVQDKTALYTNDVKTTYPSSQTTTFTTLLNLYMFARNNNGSVGNYFFGKLYFAKILDNDILVRDFIPVKRRSDNAVGMYDKVEKKFYGNAGTGSFIAGSELPMPTQSNEVQELRLPYNGNKYRFFDYIESTGTQYINLGKPFNTDTVEFIYSNATSALSGAYMFGTYPSESRYTITCNPDNEHVFAYKGTQVFRVKKGQDKCVLKVNPTEGSVDFNGTKYSITKGTITSTTNVFLFSASNTGNVPYEISRLAKLRVYSFKTWSPNGILTRHIIPAQRLSDNAIGMFDKVSGEFFGNKGTGVFIAGNEIVNIPKEYERLEYLESSGTQYIDTGIKAIANSKVEMKFNRTGYAGQASVSAIFGGYDSNQRNYGLAIDTSTIYWMFGGQSNAKKTFPLDTDYDVVFDAANKTFTVGDYTQSFSSLSLPAQSNGNIYLFTNSAVGSLATYNKQYWLKGKIYYFKYYENGTLVRNLFPVRRKADNVLGMYDAVEGKFYTNAGTGSFTTSTNTMPNKVMIPFWKRYPDVPKEYEVKEYLESDGYAQIDSGIRFTQGDKIDLVGRFIDPKHDDGLICMTPWNQGNSSRFMFACAIQGSGQSFCMSYNNLAGGNNRVSPYFTPDAEYHRWTYEDLTLTIDDGVSSLTNTDVYPDDSKITGTVYLFRRFNGGCKVAIKYYNHWRNGKLIASFIPVQRKSDGVLGMYDIVTDTLFTNAGTGSFISN